MSGVDLFLLEDKAPHGWTPFSQTRPVGELLFGALLLRQRVERATGLLCAGYLGAPQLEGFDDGQEAPAVHPSRETTDVPPGGRAGTHGLLIFRSRYVPPLPPPGEGSSLQLPLGNTPLRLVAGAQTVGWFVPAEEATVLQALRERPGEAHAILHGISGDTLNVPGRLLERPWTLMTDNPDQVAKDLGILFPDGRGPGVSPLPPISGVSRMGGHPVSAEPEVEVAPGTILDTRNGPIHLARQVQVEPRTHLRGPAFIGPGSTLLGGQISALSCGPVCKLHGEIDHSVILGYCNKAHHGFLGHSILGRWVNLGAMTTNSDLKNTYGTVRMRSPRDGEIDTGLLKVGVFLGDHVRTGIGTLLNTGTVVGAGSTLFAGELPPRWVPPFSWGKGQDLIATRLEPFLTTTRRAMSRRNLELSAGMTHLLERLWGETHSVDAHEQETLHGGPPETEEGPGPKSLGTNR